MNIQFISSPLCCVFMFQGCKSSVLVSQNVRDVVTCVQCNKLRLFTLNVPFQIGKTENSNLY